MFSQLHPAPTIEIDQLHAATAIYTAAHVINDLLDRLDWPGRPGTLLDPSAGDGAFLIAALKRLDLSNPLNLNRIRGWEIHPAAAHEAQTTICEYLQEQGFELPQASRLAKTIVVNKDFLVDGPVTERFDVIAGNPPYLCFRRFPPYFKALYGSEVVAPYARGDILHAFLDSCTKLLTPNGKIGLICSDRFLINDTTAELREQIGKRVGISHLARLDQRTAFYRPKRRVKNSPPRIHPVEVIFEPLQNAPFRLSESPLFPDGLDENNKQTHKQTLSDIAKVSLAPWLGPEGIFVIDRDTAHELRQYAELIPAVDTDDIDRKTNTLTTPTRYLIKTSPTTKPSIQVQRHLQATISRMPPRGQRPTYWLPPEIPKLSLTQPSLLIPRIARNLRVIDLPAGVHPINHNLSIVSADTIPLSEIKEILLSERSQNWIKENSPRLENGYLSITTKRLRRLPI